VQVERVAVSVPGATSGFPSEKDYPVTNHLRTGHWERKVKRHRLCDTRRLAGFPILAGALSSSFHGCVVTLSLKRTGDLRSDPPGQARELFNLGLVRALEYEIASADLKSSIHWARAASLERMRLR
jgi:hypothetical protein